MRYPTNQPTDRPTDQPTDTTSYRGALSHLKSLSPRDEKENQINGGAEILLKSERCGGWKVDGETRAEGMKAGVAFLLRFIALSSELDNV